MASEGFLRVFSIDDHRHMARALQLAARGLYTTEPNPRVGCVVVRDGEVVGEGWHQFAGGPHAEVNALRAAGERARGATVYVTLEPCCHYGKTPPCSDALLEAKVARVVAAMGDPNPRVAGKGLEQLRAAGVTVAQGLMAAEAEALNPGFVKRMRKGRPWVRVKSAMSLDARTAMASGESVWITGTAAREDVHKLRLRSSVVLTGIGTVLADDPMLNVRLPEERLREIGVEGEPRQPPRVVLDPDLAMSPTAKMLEVPAPLLLFTAAADNDRRLELERAGAVVTTVRRDRDGVDIDEVLASLASAEVNEVLVEAGSKLNGAVIRAGLADELVIYVAPHLMGSEARPLYTLPGLEQMAQRIELEISDVRAVGRDWRITARVVPKA